MTRTHNCEQCGAVLDPAKLLRCTKCKACCYCSAACQKRNWRIHKRVCSTDPLLRRFVPVEMAVERAVAKQPKVQAPKQAFCYICLEGDDSGKLMRGCACRGDSAGYVHLECLTKLAMSKEASGDLQVVFDTWSKCGNCKQDFQGALGLEMTRRFWRHHRSRQNDRVLRYNSTKNLAISLGANDEVDAANELVDEASNIFRHDKELLLELKLLRVKLRIKNGQKTEALKLMQAVLPEAKVCTANPHIYCRAMQQLANILLDLDRHQEAHEVTTELVAYSKAHYGMEHLVTLIALTTYAIACAQLGRVEESKETFEDAFITQTRILGRDHPYTQITLERMQIYGFAQPSG